MMKTFILVLSFIVLVSSQAFSSSGISFGHEPPVPPDKGRLYILSADVPSVTPGPKIQINGKDFMNLHSMSYSFIDLPKGVYKLSFVSAATGVLTTDVYMVAGVNEYQFFNAYNGQNSEYPSTAAFKMFKMYIYVDPINPKI
jgi:hypothetical protein